jgi:hypothetical protein
MLEDLPGHILFEAARLHIAQSRFFPSWRSCARNARACPAPDRARGVEDKYDPIAQQSGASTDYNDRGITLQQHR